MPFQSKAQVRKFGALVKEGKITQSKFDEWLAATPSVKKLPERIGPPRNTLGSAVPGK